MHGLGVRFIVGGCLVLLGLFAAAPRAAAAAPRQDAPAALLATVAIGPVTTLRGLAAYVEAVSPGASAGLNDRALRRELADAIGVRSLDGVDPTSWMYLLVVSTSGPPVLGLLARVSDARAVADSAAGSAVIKRGWAVIGDKPVTDGVGAYALATLAAQPAPRAPGAILYLPHLLARYRTEIEQGHKQLIAQFAQAPGDQMMRMMVPVLDGMIQGLGEIDQVAVTLEASPDLVALDLALTPRPKSRLAGFVGVQRPSDYALLDKLPAAAGPTSVIAGHLEAGPYRDGVFELTATVLGAEAKEMVDALGAFFKATTGDLAATLHARPGAGMLGTQLFGVSDAAAASQAIARLLELFGAGRTFGSPQMTTTITPLPDAPVHDGVALRGYHTSYDLSKIPPAQRQAMERFAPAGGVDTRLAVFDRFGTVVTGLDSIADASRLIDAARGKAPRFVTPPAIARFLTGSRARKDSMAMAIDIAGFLASMTGAPQGGGAAPLLVSLGFADRRAHFRVAAPVASVRAMMAAVQP
jgi:hypothetical protein